MRVPGFAPAILLAVIFVAPVFSQTQPSDPGSEKNTDADKDKTSDADKEKKKKEFEERVQRVIEGAIVEAGSLRLPQNRAVVYAISGDLYWQFDEKKARELFRSAAAEIIN